MFEQAFESPRRTATMLTSGLLHLALLSALLTVSFWRAGEPPDPPERILAFFRPPAEPIPTTLVDAPRGSPEGGSRHASSALPRRPAAVVPRDIPDAPPSAAASEESPVEASAGGEDASPGLGPGVVAEPAGVPDGGGAAEIRSANAPDVTPPVALVTTEPRYPTAAMHLRQQGVVILEAIIDTGGAVRSARVLRSAGELLDREAERAVLTWRYRPARVGARPVAVYLTVTVRFSMPA